MHRPNAHATRLKISTPNFVEGVVSMMYLVPYVEFCMLLAEMKASRMTSLNYQKKSVIVSSFSFLNLL
jgi:hypothetical protein